jgi:predicted NAD/FAD-dependent oxidoreductase
MAQRAAVIGAGLAGVACARRLADAGWDVELIDEALGPGGRLATSTASTPIGEAVFDHGAQHLTVRTDEFAAKMKSWVAVGAAEAWSARLVSVDERGVSRPVNAIAWIGRPGMSAIAEAELQGLPVRGGAPVRAIRGERDLWRVVFPDEAERGFYHAVVVATPADRAAELLEPVAPYQATAARRVRAAPCWTGLFAFDRPIEAPYDGAKLAKGPLAWVARESSKPGRGGPETWVAHAAPGWSFEFASLKPEDAAPRLLEAFRRRLRTPEPVWKGAHFWRAAMVERAVGSPFGWDAAAKVGSCGDWYLGPRAELAWQSGDGLARAMIEDEDVTTS